jgi:hypothetical protein
MMDFIEILKQFNLDPIIVVLIICGGFAAKTYISWEFIHIGKFRMALKDAWKTLIVGSLFCGIYLAILWKTDAMPEDIYLRFFYSYIFTTSLYELMIKPFTGWVTKNFNSADKEQV